VTPNALVRLNSDGSLDSGFQSQNLNPIGFYSLIEPLTDGSIGLEGTNVIKQNSDGTVASIVADSGATVLVFTASGGYVNSTTSNGVTQIVGYTSAGIVDPYGPNFGSNEPVQLYAASSGQFYMQTSERIVRINRNASLDLAFKSVEIADRSLFTYGVILPDNTLLVVGDQSASKMAPYIHYDSNGNSDYMLKADDDSLTLAGVIFDRIKNSGQTADVFTRVGLSSVYIDVRGDGQLTILNAEAPLKRYTAVSPANATVLEKPVILSFSSEIDTQFGAHVIMEVSAAGLQPLSYQWYFNGIIVPGETYRQFSPIFVNLSSLGNYSVVISNSAGSVTSPNLKLNVPNVFSAKFSNISTRAFVGTGSSIEIGGSLSVELSQSRSSFAD